MSPKTVGRFITKNFHQHRHTVLKRDAIKAISEDSIEDEANIIVTICVKNAVDDGGNMFVDNVIVRRYFCGYFYHLARGQVGPLYLNNNCCDWPRYDGDIFLLQKPSYFLQLSGRCMPCVLCK